MAIYTGVRSAVALQYTDGSRDGGLAVLLGVFVPLASRPMTAILLVATFTVHLPYGFSSIKLQAVMAADAQFGPPGYETDLFYLACLAAPSWAAQGHGRSRVSWQRVERPVVCRKRLAPHL